MAIAAPRQAALRPMLRSETQGHSDMTGGKTEPLVKALRIDAGGVRQ
jgi:hypothetical protein